MPTEPDEQYFKHLEAGELKLQRCQQCDHWIFPPSTTCPKCLGAHLEWRKVSGRGTLWSWIRMHRQYFGDLPREVPYNVAFVKLAEGPKMISALVDPPADLSCDTDVELVIAPIGDTKLPQFKVVS